MERLQKLAYFQLESWYLPDPLSGFLCLCDWFFGFTGVSFDQYHLSRLSWSDWLQLTTWWSYLWTSCWLRCTEFSQHSEVSCKLYYFWQLLLFSWSSQVDSANYFCRQAPNCPEGPWQLANEAPSFHCHYSWSFCYFLHKCVLGYCQLERHGVNSVSGVLYKWRNQATTDKSISCCGHT